MTTWLVAAALWLAAWARLRAVLFTVRRTSIAISYLVATAFEAAALTAKGLNRTIDQALGPFTGNLIEHVLVVGAGCGAQLVTLSLQSEKALTRSLVLRRVRTAASVVAAIALCFVIAPVHDVHAVGDLRDLFGHQTSVVAYYLVFNAYLAAVLVDNARLCLRHVSRNNRTVRLNVWLVGAGSIVALGYALSRSAWMILSHYGAARPLWIESIGSSATLVGLLLIALGIVIPSTARWTERWRQVKVRTATLEPLWTDLTEAFPVVVLKTRAPWTLAAALFRYERVRLEVSECLTSVYLDPSPSLQLSVPQLAGALVESTPCWTLAVADRSVADLLPRVRNEDERELQLLELGREYDRAKAHKVEAGSHDTVIS